MSGIEILGIAAGVLQIADAGARLSNKLFVVTRKIKNADRAIAEISLEIAATGAALRELGEVLQQDRYAGLGSQQSFEATKQIVADCWKVFSDINDTIGGDLIVKRPSHDGSTPSQVLTQRFDKSSFTFKQKLMFPFLEPQIVSLRVKLESLKSSLILMMQVLMLAEQVRSRPQTVISDDQKTLIETLVEERNDKEKQFRVSVLAIEDPPQPQKSDSPDTSKASDNTSATETHKSQSLHTSKAASSGSNETPQKATPAHVAASAAIRHGTVALASSTSNITHQQASRDIASSLDSQKERSIAALPAVLRIRQEEIQHHLQLVNQLLGHIADTQCRLDHGIRHRLHNGVLRLHWLEWASYVEKHGIEHFIDLFEGNDCQAVAKYWLDEQHGHHEQQQQHISGHETRMIDPEVERKLAREEKLLQVAKDMRVRTGNAALLANLDKRINESEKNIAYLETELHREYSRSSRAATSSPGSSAADLMPPRAPYSRPRPNFSYSDEAQPARSASSNSVPPPSKGLDAVPASASTAKFVPLDYSGDVQDEEKATPNDPEQKVDAEAPKIGVGPGALYDLLGMYTSLTEEERQKASRS